MEGEHSQNNENLTQSLKKRKEELEYIDSLINTIKDNKDNIKSIVLALEMNNNQTFKGWQGSLNQCYGLSERLKINIESNMCEFDEDWREE